MDVEPIEVINLISDEESVLTPVRRGIKRRRIPNIPAPLCGPKDDDIMIVSHTKRGKNDLSSKATSAATTTTKVEGEVELVGEQRGVDALADYPHFRFQCSKKSPTTGRGGKKQRYCQLCFCYVCDIPAAQCLKWSVHEHAVDTSINWRAKRMETIGTRQRTERKNAPTTGASFTAFSGAFPRQGNNMCGVGKRKRVGRRKGSKGARGARNARDTRTTSR